MASDRDRPSLKDRTADQIRNAQRAGDLSPPDANREDGPEGNATMRRVWSQPGDEAYNYRNAKPRAGDTDGHSDLTAGRACQARWSALATRAFRGARKNDDQAST